MEVIRKTKDEGLNDGYRLISKQENQKNVIVIIIIRNTNDKQIKKVICSNAA